VNSSTGAGGAEPPEISAARERLREEIDRVRAGVEQMLAEQDGEGSADLRRELDRLRLEGRRYAKRRVGKSEKKLERSIEQVDGRVNELEQRFDAFEQERLYAEWRIHTSTEAMLDGLLREVRAIADLLSRMH
jgi:chromosome segregation ATPase